MKVTQLHRFEGEVASGVARERNGRLIFSRTRGFGDLTSERVLKLAEELALIGVRMRVMEEENQRGEKWPSIVTHPIRTADDISFAFDQAIRFDSNYVALLVIVQGRKDVTIFRKDEFDSAMKSTKYTLRTANQSPGSLTFVSMAHFNNFSDLEHWEVYKKDGE